jgi:cytochrome c553
VRSTTAGRWAAGLTALFIGAAKAQLAQVPSEKLKTCAACHGADGVSRTAGVPSLAGQPKLFLENYLVLTREGIAGTDVMRGLLKGMPDREISALASHYSRLPPGQGKENIDRNLFERGKQVAAKTHCGSCHLPDFRGREQMPRLAGQREDFLYDVMRAYQRNKRPGGDTLMAAALYGIAETDLKALAHYLSRLK